jgi:hypothetical protein
LVQETINMQITKVNEIKEASSTVDTDIATCENKTEAENNVDDVTPLEN